MANLPNGIINLIFSFVERPATNKIMNTLLKIVIKKIIVIILQNIGMTIFVSIIHLKNGISCIENIMFIIKILNTNIRHQLF